MKFMEIQKKFIVMAMVVVFCLVGQVQADKIGDAGALLLTLIHKKVAYCDENATDMFIYVEPLWWKKQTHTMKTAVVQAGMVIAGGTDQPKEGVIVQEMTSKSIVAIGFIKKGTIKIYK
jgi:hypothetical protein